jgi:putative heme iron utilization protein
MMHSVELKKTSVQKLKKDIEQVEKDTGIRLAEIDAQNIQLSVSTVFAIDLLYIVFGRLFKVANLQISSLSLLWDPILQRL